MAISTRKTKSGTKYQVRYRDPLGRQVSRQFDTKKEALNFEANERTTMRDGSWIDTRATDVLFKDWAYEWLESNPGKRENSYARDEIIVRIHLVPAFGNRPLPQISPLDIQKVVSQWSTKSAPHTVHRQYRSLAAIMHAAVNCDLLIKTPCRGIKLPRIPRRKTTTLDGSTLAKLVDALSEYGPMASIGAILGLRWGEVAGLRVSDLDLLNRRIHVVQQLTRTKNGEPVVSVPKTESSVRTISIPPSLAAELASHLQKRELTAANSDALIFSDPNGQPLRYSNWRRRTWVPARDVAGVSTLGFHDLRRANATAMVAAGVDIKTAQARLGHADARMTLNIYAQATSKADIDAAGLLAQHFSAGA